MATIIPFIDKLLTWEGGEKYTNDASDPGGATKWGITLATWKIKGQHPDKDNNGIIDAEDIKLLTKQDFLVVLKKNFWDQCNADLIKNQSVAEYLVDWTYNAGNVAAKAIQRILGLTVDGQIGPKSIEAINSHDQKELHDRLVNARVTFYENLIAAKPALAKYRKGWIRRALSYKFEE